jgi:hypothetical protein
VTAVLYDTHGVQEVAIGVGTVDSEWMCRLWITQKICLIHMRFARKVLHLVNA